MSITSPNPFSEQTPYFIHLITAGAYTSVHHTGRTQWTFIDKWINEYIMIPRLQWVLSLQWLLLPPFNLILVWAPGSSPSRSQTQITYSCDFLEEIRRHDFVNMSILFCFIFCFVFHFKSGRGKCNRKIIKHIWSI